MKQITYSLWIKVLNVFEDGNTKAYIGRKYDITYAHINDIMRIFINKGIMKTEKKGRNTHLYLTPKGQELQGHVKELMRISAFDKKPKRK